MPGNNGSFYSFFFHFIYCSCSKPLQNYMVFNDTEGVYTYTFEAEKKVSQQYDGISDIIILRNEG